MRFLIVILVTTLAAFGLGFYLSVPANPEVKFWHEVMQRREAEIVKVRKEQPNSPIIFFTGGSSCAFSIDPKIIEETCNLPAFNLGLPVSAGNKYILHQAMALTKPSDILVVCIEPDTITDPKHYLSTNLSYALASLDGNPSDSAGGVTFEEKLSLNDHMNLARPGTRYLTTLIAKTIAGKSYRYTATDYRYHGRLETQVSDPNMKAVGPNSIYSLSTAGRELLISLRNAAKKRGVRLVYSMPWQYTSEKSIEENRTNRKSLLKEIEEIIPVIDDGCAGSVSDKSYFSDSGLHLAAEGSKQRTQALAAKLNDWVKPSTR
jgi:hypothetical protein